MPIDKLIDVTDDQVEQIMKQVSKDARKRLMGKDLIFFGLCLWKYRWIADTNCPEGALAYVSFNPSNLDDLVAGAIFINGKIVGQPDFTYNHMAFFLTHELLHVLNGHGYRRGSKDPFLWNIATDHVINKFIRKIYDQGVHDKMKNLIEPYGGYDHVVYLKDLDSEKDNCSAEEAYEWLVKNFKNKYKVVSVNGEPFDSSNGNMPGKSNGEQPDWFEIEDKKTGKKFIVSNQALDEGAAKKSRDAQSEARAAFEAVKNRGIVSDGVARYLDEILKVEIPWTQLLEEAIKQSAVMIPSGRSWRQLNKFYSPHGLTLPGIEFAEENEGVGTIIVGVDTSGSITKKETQEFASIIMDSIKYFKNVRVLVHDVDVHQDLTYDKDNILEFQSMLATSGFKGGGGTSHGPIFKKIEHAYDEDPDDISMAVFLTDAYSDIESVWNQYNWSKKVQIPTFFVITQNGRFIGENADSHKEKFKQIKINTVDDK